MSDLLPPADLRKLVGILGMLGSSHDGERASAGLLATRLLQERGLTWSHLLSPSSSTRIEGPARGDDWGSHIEACMQRPGLLTPWERSFIDSLRARQRTPTPKQQLVLADIAQQLRSRCAP